mmetsp:Transcript_21429/g.42042  ORF Transcript_21429/g.42042 Transcript_21429/m.42042 type:complete len:183 (+) Transcript_21429:1984-2532(+)
MRKLCVFGQEPIAGMDSLGSACEGNLTNFVSKQVALRRSGSSKPVRLVSLFHMFCGSVRVTVDRYGPHSKSACSPENTASDLASIRHENFVKHLHLASAFKPSLPCSLRLRRRRKQRRRRRRRPPRREPHRRRLHAHHHPEPFLNPSQPTSNQPTAAASFGASFQPTLPRDPTVDSARVRAS